MLYDMGLNIRGHCMKTSSTREYSPELGEGDYCYRSLRWNRWSKRARQNTRFHRSVTFEINIRRIRGK